MTQSTPAMTEKSRTLLAIVTITLCTALAYLPALSAEFVWDDDYHLTNSVITKDGALYRIWCTAEMANYWPIAWTSYWLEYQIWGLTPFGYHLVNIAIHIASSILLWKVLTQLRIPIPAVAALIFAVHPINVESVAWISQRRNVLSLFFYLASLSCYLEFDSQPIRKRKWHTIAILLFILAMLSKGSAVMLPVVLLMSVLWLRTTLCRKDLLNCLPFFIIALCFSVVEVWFQYVRAIGDFTIRDDSFFARLAGAGWVIWFYLYKTVWPTALCFVYPRWEINETNLAAWLPGLLLAGLLWLCWSFRQSWGRGILFGLGYFIIALTPFLGFFTIFFMRYSFVADHYAYFSTITIIAIITGVGDFCRRRSTRGAILYPLIVATVVIALGTLTWQRCMAFQNAETLWRDTLLKNPQCWLAHNDLGNLLWIRGDLNEASEHFLLALEINPNFPETHVNYGGLLDELGRTGESIKHLRQAIQLKPNLQAAQSKLTEVLLKLDTAEDSALHYRQILHRDPGAAWAHLGLGHLLLQQQKLDEALHHCRIAVEIAPQSARTHFLLGSVLHARKDLVNARHHLQFAVLHEPDNADAHYHLGTVLGDMGQFSQAEFHFHQAVRINPTDHRSENNLGLLMENRGNIQGAVHHFRRGIRTKPDDPLLHFNLGRMLDTAGRRPEALDCFREALRLKPDFEIATQFMKRIQEEK